MPGYRTNLSSANSMVACGERQIKGVAILLFNLARSISSAFCHAIVNMDQRESDPYQDTVNHGKDHHCAILLIW